MTDSSSRTPGDFWKRYGVLNYPRALVHVLAGLLAVLYPQKSVLSLIRVLGLLFLADGAVLVPQVLFSIRYDRKWPLFLLRCGTALLAGLFLTLRGSGITLENALLYMLLLAVLYLFCGTLDIIRAFHYRSFLHTEMITILGGAFCFAVGVFLLASTVGFSPGIQILVGVLMILFGLYTGGSLWRRRKKKAEQV